jgi:hypothetical protein
MLLRGLQRPLDRHGWTACEDGDWAGTEVRPFVTAFHILHGSWAIEQ